MLQENWYTIFLNMLYTCSLARKLLYDFLKYVKESIAGHVQDFIIIIRVGSLWIEVHMGALVNHSIPLPHRRWYWPMNKNSTPSPRQVSTLLWPKHQIGEQGKLLLLQKKRWHHERCALTMCVRCHHVRRLLATSWSLQVSRLQDVKLTQALFVQH
jgi:hypothetical protein